MFILVSDSVPDSGVTGVTACFPHSLPVPREVLDLLLREDFPDHADPRNIGM